MIKGFPSYSYSSSFYDSSRRSFLHKAHFKSLIWKNKMYYKSVVDNELKNRCSRNSFFDLLPRLHLQQLSNRLVTVMLQSWIVPKYLISHIFGNLTIKTCLGFLVSGCVFIPFFLLFLFLQFLHPFNSLLAGNWLGIRIPRHSAQNIIFVLLLSFCLMNSIYLLLFPVSLVSCPILLHLFYPSLQFRQHFCHFFIS